jgi:hypothetical protein
MSNKDQSSTKTGEGESKSTSFDGEERGSNHPTPSPSLTLPRSTFHPRTPNETERQSLSSHMESMVAQPLPSQIPNNSNRLFAYVDRVCSHAQDHEMGVFCLYCRGIHMPWGEDLPKTHQDNGEQLLRAPVGTMLAGVNLRSRGAIATLSTVAYLEVTRQPHTTVDGLARLESLYPASAQAGRRVARLQNTLRNIAGEEPSSVPNHYDIIHRALLEPFLSESALGDSLLSGAPNTDDPMSSAPPMQRRSLGGATHHGKESYDDEPTDSDNEAHSDGKLRMEKRIMPKEKHGWNRPAKRRNWEFVPGTDLEVAEVGKPDPSKFFLVRQNKDNPLEKDIRQYAGWETLDWDDPNDIESLNSARRQVRKRTSGKIAVSRMPYTQMEKDVLKSLVQQAIQSGKDRLTIDWDEISRNMSKHFEGIVQEPGQPMARTSKVVAGQEKTPKHKVQTLKTRRNGTANRAGRAIQAQAERYGDIWLMLIASKPLGKRGRERSQKEGDRGC